MAEEQPRSVIVHCFGCGRPMIRPDDDDEDFYCAKCAPELHPNADPRTMEVYEDGDPDEEDNDVQPR